MRLALITVGDLKFSPYIKNHIEMLKDNGISYDIIHWNRSGDDRVYAENEFAYKNVSNYAKGKFSKIKDFLGFKSFVKTHLSQNAYDRLIVYTSQCGVLLKSLLVREYHGRYILDIRDLSLEKFLPYKMLEKNVINCSAFTFVSSIGFLQKLPNSNKYVISHNMQKDTMEMDMRETKNPDEPIRIAFLGIIRDFKGITDFINFIGNDKRFVFNIHGSGVHEESIRKFVIDNRYKNVFLHGYYQMAEKKDLLNNTDILMNFYDERTNNLLATTNKYYDAICAGVPQITNKATFNNELVEKNNLGVGIDIKTNSANDIYDYYKKLDFQKFTQNCVMVKERIIQEIAAYDKRIISFLFQAHN